MNKRDLLTKFGMLIFILVFLTLISTDFYYASKMPEAPDVNLKRTVKLNFNHGSIVYVTEKEYHIYDYIGNICLPGGVLVIFFLFIAKVIANGKWRR